MSTTRWYDENAQAFAKRTQTLDMSHLQNRFLAYLPQGGSILDAGCGAGRDSKAFIEKGFDVTAIDASANMAGVAQAYIGRPVQVMRFQEVAWHGTFDGIWACASLLHVPNHELPSVFERLARALKPGGILYASFKLGNGERQDARTGRHFTDMTEVGVVELARQVSVLELLTVWTTEDVRPEERLVWVDMLLKRIPALPANS